MYSISRSVAAVRQIPLIPALTAVVGVLLVAYIGLLAFVMTYGAMQMQYAQTVRDTNAHIGTLETTYLSMISKINHTNPTTLGYTKPTDIAYVTGTNAPTVSMRTQ